MYGSLWENLFSLTRLAAVLLVASASLISCGSDSKKKSPSGPNGASVTTWQKDYFLPRSTYKNRCQFLRSGVSPDTGSPYPDVRGSMLEELYYLRSLTEETYLFKDDLTDMDPSPYNQVQSTFAAHAEKMDEYFDELKTEELTATNTPKDKYHYTYLTSDWIDRIQNVAQPSYGISWVNLGGSEIRNGRTYVRIPRDYRVRYVIPGSPAAELVGGSPKVKRGDKILKVNGEDFIRGNSSKLNAAFSVPSGTSTTFVLMDVDTNQEKTVVLTAKNISQKPVNDSTILEIGDDKVGYIHYTTFVTNDSDSAIHDVIKDFKSKGVTDLVLDIRYNGGGYLVTSSMVGYMIAGRSNTIGKVFDRNRFVEGSGNINPVTGRVEIPLPFLHQGYGTPLSIRRGTPLESLNLNRVYILSTERTCSASENLINGLIGADIEVVLIGGTTCGKPYGFYPEDNCGISYFTIQTQSHNHKGFGGYGDGFVPSAATSGAKVKGCAVPDDFTKQLGDSSEALLAAALKFRKDGTCPVAPSALRPTDIIASGEGMADQRSPRSDLEAPEDPFYFDERIMSPE